MDLLLTGASGFLGKNLLAQAPPDWRILALYRNSTTFPQFVSGLGNNNITAAQCDLADAAQVESLFRKFGNDWEACLYLAAQVDIPWSVREPKQDLISNTAPLIHLLESIRAGRFVYFSSGAVYDGLNGEIQPATPVSPTLPYAISKVACESYVRFFGSRRRSIDQYLLIRFFGAYGPYEAAHKIYSRVIKAFAVEHQSQYKIYGNGQNLIDAMYVDDAVEAIRLILTGSHWNDTLNLAAGHPMTIEDLVLEAGRALGVRNVQVELEGIAHESNRFWGSTHEMRNLYGFESKIRLSEGILRFRDFLCGTEGAAAGHKETRG